MFAHARAVTMPATRTIALPDSVRTNARNGADRSRAHAVRPRHRLTPARESARSGPEAARRLATRRRRRALARRGFTHPLHPIYAPEASETTETSARQMILPAELAGEGLMRAVCRWTGSVVRCGVALCISSQVQDSVVVGWRRTLPSAGVSQTSQLGAA